jgi:hypothetical protein
MTCATIMREIGISTILVPAGIPKDAYPSRHRADAHASRQLLRTERGPARYPRDEVPRPGSRRRSRLLLMSRPLARKLANGPGADPPLGRHSAGASGAAAHQLPGGGDHATALPPDKQTGAGTGTAPILSYVRPGIERCESPLGRRCRQGLQRLPSRPPIGRELAPLSKG